MKWTVVTDPRLKRIFGESLETVYRGRHLVMSANASRQYVVQESMTRKVVACSIRKGDCYKELRMNYRGTQSESKRA